MRAAAPRLPDAAALRERQLFHDQMRQLFELPGWAHLEAAWEVELLRATAKAHQPPADGEQPHQRYYYLGYWHGVRMASQLARKLLETTQLNDQEKARMGMELVR